MAFYRNVFVLCVVVSVLFFTQLATNAQTATRTKQQVEDLIRTEGSKPPTWWQDVQLDYPRTLNLDIPDYVSGSNGIISDMSGHMSGRSSNRIHIVGVPGSNCITCS